MAFDHNMGNQKGFLGFVLIAWALIGCGAKTGLRSPDVGVDARDASTDVPLDVRPDVPCVEIPFDGGAVELPLSTEVQVGRADVMFLVDTTSSMVQEIEQIRNNLRDRLVPGIQASIADSAFAVGTLADFPLFECGSKGDIPFQMLLPVSSDIARVQAAVDNISLSGGLDEPEAQVEALYQLATGEGLGTYVSPSIGCPRGGTGYPCFRFDALRVVLLFTDAPFHSGPGNSNPYACSPFPVPHRYQDAIDALNAIDVKVMGLYSGNGDGFDDLERTVIDTDAIDTMAPGGNRPLVFDIGQRGQGLSEAVINSIRTLSEVIRFDIDMILFDPDPNDGVNPVDFIERIEAVSANPMNAVSGIDQTTATFLDAQTGVTVLFRVILRNDAVAPGPAPQRFRIVALFRGDGRTRLGEREFDILVPGQDGMGCE